MAENFPKTRGTDWVQESQSPKQDEPKKSILGYTITKMAKAKAKTLKEEKTESHTKKTYKAPS